MVLFLDYRRHVFPFLPKDFVFCFLILYFYLFWNSYIFYFSLLFFSSLVFLFRFLLSFFQTILSDTKNPLRATGMVLGERMEKKKVKIQN